MSLIENLEGFWDLKNESFPHILASNMHIKRRYIFLLPVFNHLNVFFFTQFNLKILINFI